MATTPKWALPYPIDANTPDVPRDIGALALALDDVAKFAQGTFAARGSAATRKAGFYYYATDTFVLYLSDGTNWVTLTKEVPIGCIFDYAGDGDPGDTRYILCDGRAISRTTYSELFAEVGTAYGVGNGSTTFNIPDYRGRVAPAPDNMGTAQGAASRLTTNNTRGAVGGAQSVTLTEAQIPAHTHTHTLSGGAAGSHSHSAATGSSGAHVHTASTSTTGSHSHGTTGAHAHGAAGGNFLTNGFAGTSAGLALTSPGSYILNTSGTTSAGDHNHGAAGDHTHTVTVNSDGAHTHTISTDGSHSHTITGSIASTGGGSSHSVLQPYVVTNKLIKVL